MDEIDRAILNQLQTGFPICASPFLKVAKQLGIVESDLLQRILRMRADGMLSRFGPMYHAEQMGGALTLAALKVPEERYDEVTDIVNSFPEVAHNYARNHVLNMWFVLASDEVDRLTEVIAAIESGTGLRVYDMPKIREYYVGLNFAV